MLAWTLKKQNTLVKNRIMPISEVKKYHNLLAKDCFTWQQLQMHFAMKIQVLYFGENTYF